MLFVLLIPGELLEDGGRRVSTVDCKKSNRQQKLGTKAQLVTIVYNVKFCVNLNVIKFCTDWTAVAIT